MRPTMQKQRFHFRIVTASIRRTIACEVYDRFWHIWDIEEALKNVC